MTRPVLFLVPAGALAREERCRSCGARIVWIVTMAGRWMPVSLEKAQRNVLGELEAPSHFADCPNAAEHRRPRPRRAS